MRAYTKAPFWKFAEVSPATPEFKNLTEGEKVTFVPLEDVWPEKSGQDFELVNWHEGLTGYTPFKRGDLLVPKVTPTVTHGRTMITRTDTLLGVASTEVYTVRPRPSTDPRWLAYFFVSLDFLDLAGASVQGTGGLKRISTQFVESFPVPNFSSAAQTIIADYLDRETAEIDAMSADLDEMEALLDERRKAVISGVISQLDCERQSLRYIGAGDGALFLDGDWVESKDQDPNGSSRLLQLADVGDGVFRDKSDRWVNDEKFEALNCTALEPNDLLIARMPDPIARACLVPELDYRSITVVDVAILRLSEQDDPRFVMHAVNSEEFRGRVAANLTGSTRQRISRSALGREEIPRPNLETQRRVVLEIDQELGEIDSMLADIQELRVLLAERRSALITAAVTGQINIPGLTEAHDGEDY